MTESSTTQPPAISPGRSTPVFDCPDWCELHAPKKLHQHEADLIVVDGRLQVYVDHERSFRVNDKGSIEVNAAIYDDGHVVVSVSLDMDDETVTSAHGLLQLADAAEKAAAFVDVLLGLSD